MAACRFGENVAEPPVDGAAMGADADPGTGSDAPAPCTGTADGDADGIPDCTELTDDHPFTDPARFNGLHAIIGDKPGLAGSCNNLDDYAEMETRFDTPVQEADVRAGWHFDADVNTYNDPMLGFEPNWPEADAGKFSVRFRGQIHLTAGEHCFRVDIGATGTGIGFGHNACGQIYVGVGGPPSAALVETGFDADSLEAARNCLTIPADGGYPIDIVLWQWETSIHNLKLHALHCAGAMCDPTTPIPATMVQAQR